MASDRHKHLELERFYIDEQAPQSKQDSIKAQLESRGCTIMDHPSKATRYLVADTTLTASIDQRYHNRLYSLEFFENYLGRNASGKRPSPLLSDLPHNLPNGFPKEHIIVVPPSVASTSNDIFPTPKVKTTTPNMSSKVSIKRPGNNPYTDEEKRLVEEYMASRPNVMPNTAFWRQFVKECPWARAHSDRSWAAWWHRQVHGRPSRAKVQTNPSTTGSGDKSDNIDPAKSTKVKSNIFVAPLAPKNPSTSNYGYSPSQLAHQKWPTNSERYRNYNKYLFDEPVKTEPSTNNVQGLDSSSSHHSHETLSSSHDESNKEEGYEIERIIAARINKKSGKLEYRIKWKGWSSVFNSWQEADETLDLEDDVFGDFYDRNPDAPRPPSPSPSSSPTPSDDEEVDCSSRGCAYWRRRPLVLVANSEPSQSTSAAYSQVHRVQMQEKDDAEQIEARLKEASLHSRINAEGLGLGPVPRPWLPYDNEL